MLTTGIRSEVGVKVFGTDLATLEASARRVADVVRSVPGREQRLSGTGDERPVPEHQRRSRGRRALRHRRRRHPAGDRERHRRNASDDDDRRARSGFPCACATRRSSAPIPQALGSVLVASPAGRADPARPARAHRARARAGDDLVRERAAARHGAAERPGPRRRRLRRRGAGGPSRARCRCRPGYYIGWSGRWENQEHARAAAADRAADRAAGDLRPAVLHLSTRRSKRRTCCWPCRSR